MDQLEEICQSIFNYNFVIFNIKYFVAIQMRDVNSEKRGREEVGGTEDEVPHITCWITLRDHSAQ